MKTRPCMTKATSREGWSWYSKLKNCKISENIGSKFCSLTSLGITNQGIYRFFQIHAK